MKTSKEVLNILGLRQKKIGRGVMNLYMKRTKILQSKRGLQLVNNTRNESITRTGDNE